MKNFIFLRETLSKLILFDPNKGGFFRDSFCGGGDGVGSKITLPV